MRPAKITQPEVWSRWGWLVVAVAMRHGVTSTEMLGRRRHVEIVRARHDLMTCLWASGLAYIEIGRMLGLDHTTVLAAVRKELR